MRDGSAWLLYRLRQRKATAFWCWPRHMGNQPRSRLSEPRRVELVGLCTFARPTAMPRSEFPGLPRSESRRGARDPASDAVAMHYNDITPSWALQPFAAGATRFLGEGWRHAGGRRRVAALRARRKGC